MKRQILVVDDERDTVDYMAKKLELADYQSFKAYNGEDGLELLRDNRIDLVLTDIMMPGIDGISFCEKLKNAETTQDIPVIMFSAFMHESMARSCGADAFLAKPFNGEMMLQTVSRVWDDFARHKKHHKIFVYTPHEEALSALKNHFTEKKYSIAMTVFSNHQDLIPSVLRETPDLVMLDISAKDGTHTKVLKELKSYALWRSRPVICFDRPLKEPKRLFNFPHRKESVKDDCLQAGAAAFLESLHPGLIEPVFTEYLWK